PLVVTKLFFLVLGPFFSAAPSLYTSGLWGKCSLAIYLLSAPFGQLLPFRPFNGSFSPMALLPCAFVALAGGFQSDQFSFSSSCSLLFF
ncbi:MAG: hypothetical protein PF568_07020, partial [Deltaproteobacteria bacterium]|nr:hypothetical protein [Deltaproteobacteria bacterium]